MIILAALPGLVALLIYVLIAVLVLSLIYWLINRFCPEPIKGYAVAVVVVVATIFLIWFLLSLVGGGSPFR
jgi:energy-converting hydrogenase Eha subunit B